MLKLVARQIGSARYPKGRLVAAIISSPDVFCAGIGALVGCYVIRLHPCGAKHEGVCLPYTHNAVAALKSCLVRTRPANVKTHNKKGGLEMRYGPRIVTAGLLVGAAALYVGTASGADDGWVTLLDKGRKGDWNEVGKANWEMKDG